MLARRRLILRLDWAVLRLRRHRYRLTSIPHSVTGKQEALSNRSSSEGMYRGYSKGIMGTSALRHAKRGWTGSTCTTWPKSMGFAVEAATAGARRTRAGVWPSVQVPPRVKGENSFQSKTELEAYDLVLGISRQNELNYTKLNGIYVFERAPMCVEVNITPT